MPKVSCIKPKLSSKYIRFIIFEALCSYSHKNNPLTIRELHDKMFLDNSPIYDNFQFTEEDSDKFSSIERTIDRTLDDLTKLEFGITNIKVYKIPNSKPAKYYASPINIRESISSMPDAITIADISTAIKNKQLISFKYVSKHTIFSAGKISEEKRRKTYNVHPLYMLPYNNTYFLISYDESSFTYKHFIMTNIEDIVILKYPPNKTFNFDIQEYMSQHPYMLEGNPIEISLFIKPSLKHELSQIFGRFAHFSPSGNEDFPIEARVKSTAQGIKKLAFSNLWDCFVVSPINIKEEIIDEIKSSKYYLNNLMEVK